MTRYFLKANALILPLVALSIFCFGISAIQAAEEMPEETSEMSQDPGQCLKDLNAQANKCMSMVNKSARANVASGVNSVKDKISSVSELIICKSACTRVSCANKEFFAGCLSLCGLDNPNIKNCVQTAKENRWDIDSVARTINNRLNKEFQSGKDFIEQQIRLLDAKLQQIHQQTQGTAEELAKRGATAQQKALSGVAQMHENASKVIRAPGLLTNPAE